MERDSATVTPSTDRQRAVPSFWPMEIDTVRVDAARLTPREALRLAPTFATYVALGPEAPLGRDLADLIDRTAGLHVHRYGGLGALTLASVRGSTPGQVKVCLDGVPIANAGDGFVNLALLPVASLEHAEIYRGAETVGFGGAPSAGVLQLITPDAARTPLTLAAGAGSFGTRLTRGTWGGARGAASVLVSGEYRASEGDFPYRNRNGTLFDNTSDDRTVPRANNDFEEASFLAKAGLSVDRARIDYTAQRLDRASGIPGTENVQTRHVRFDTERARHHARLRFETARRASAADTEPARSRAWPSITIGAHLESIRDRFDNRDGEVGLGRARSDDATRDSGGSIGWMSHLPWFAQRLGARVESQHERFTPRDLLRGETGRSRRRSTTTWLLEDRWLVGFCRLDAAYRWMEAESRFPSTPGLDAARVDHWFAGPALGLRADLGAGLALKGSRGRLLRLPTFPELFGANGIQQGNPALRPERGVQWDAGATFHPSERFHVEAAYFESRVEDQILLLQNSQRTVKAQNLERAWVRGIESSFFAALGWNALRAEWNANVTWQEAKDVGRSRTYRGKALPNLPEREGFLSTRLVHGRWELEWSAAARSPCYRDRYNTQTKKTPAYHVHDLALERRLFRRALGLRVEVRNLGDVRVEDVDGFPLPGRSYLMEATCTWH